MNDELMQLWDQYVQEAAEATPARDPRSILIEEVDCHDLDGYPSVVRHLDPRTGLPTSLLGALLAGAAVRQTGMFAGCSAPPRKNPTDKESVQQLLNRLFPETA